MRRNSHGMEAAGRGASTPTRGPGRALDGAWGTGSVRDASQRRGVLRIAGFRRQLHARERLTPLGAGLTSAMEKGACFRKVPASLGTS